MICSLSPRDGGTSVAERQVHGHWWLKMTCLALDIKITNSWTASNILYWEFESMSTYILLCWFWPLCSTKITISLKTACNGRSSITWNHVAKTIFSCIMQKGRPKAIQIWPNGWSHLFMGFNSSYLDYWWTILFYSSTSSICLSFLNFKVFVLLSHIAFNKKFHQSHAILSHHSAHLFLLSLAGPHTLNFHSR